MALVDDLGLPTSPNGEVDNLLALLARRRPPWMADAACREHPEVDFFPPAGASVQPAKAVCAGCLVRAECLEFAMRMEYVGGGRYGVWGGTSTRERRRARARQRGLT